MKSETTTLMLTVVLALAVTACGAEELDAVSQTSQAAYSKTSVFKQPAWKRCELEIANVLGVWDMAKKRVALDIQVKNLGNGYCGQPGYPWKNFVYIYNYSVRSYYTAKNNNGAPYYKEALIHKMDVSFPAGYSDELQKLAPGKTMKLRYWPPYGYYSGWAYTPYKAEVHFLADVRYFPAPGVKGTVSPKFYKHWMVYP